MRLFFVTLLSLISISVLSQNPLGFDLDDHAKVVELDFIRESNLVIVPVKINSQGPFNFIIDTGSESGMVFDKWVIGENNLINARTVPVYATDGNKVTDLWVANNLNIHFDGVRGRQQSMLVLQENFVDIENVLGVDAHGILGSEIFSRFVVEIDYEARQLRLYEPESFKTPRGYKRIPISIENLRPFIRGKVKQKGHKPIEVKLLIDTGASSALFLDAQKYSNIHLPEKTVDHTLGRALVGVIKGKIGRVKCMTIGKKFRFRRITTSFPENWLVSHSDGNVGFDPRHGTIGSEILARFSVIFNYQKEEIYLKKNKDYRDAFRFNAVGINVLATGEELNAYFVTDVIKNSPAVKADLRAGDEIIAIDGKPAFFYKLSEINAIFRGKRGTVLTLIIRREGKLDQKRLRLKPLI